MLINHSLVREIRTVIPASLDAVGSLMTDFRSRTKTELAPRDWFAAELLLREALTNAVVHGCDRDPARRVRCVLRLKRRRLTIVVGDGGRGFDWRAAGNRQPSLSECSGRGLEILKIYATRVRFNVRGNAVAISRNLSKEFRPYERASND